MISSMDDRTWHDGRPTHPPAREKLAPKMWAKVDLEIEQGLNTSLDYLLIDEMTRAACILEAIDHEATIITTMPTPAQQEAILSKLLFELRVAEDVYATAVDDWASGCIDCDYEVVNIARIATDLAGDRYRAAMVAYGRMPFQSIEIIEF